MIKKRYIKKLDMEVAPLGFGVMRLPMQGKAFLDEARELMRLSMEAGINYYDTAYLYQYSRSEEFIHETLVSKYPRHRFYIADKLPVWLCSDRSDMETIFQTQLDRLGVDYIDFYLLHSLKKSYWTDTFQKAALDFLTDKKKKGQIRKIGFSFHDSENILESIINEFDWDFAQLQINYYDWEVQHARENYECLVERDIPCIVMEPVGGGRLANLPPKAESLFKEHNPNVSVASWAIRYAASLPNVAVVLSGMSNETQLFDNLSCFNPFVPISESEQGAINKVVQIFKDINTIPCTSCRYCLDTCPKGINIPYIFQQYNDYKIFNNPHILSEIYMAFVPDEQKANACIACGRCTEKCPQDIDIPPLLKMTHKLAYELAVGFSFECLEEYIAKSDSDTLVCFGAGIRGKAVNKYIVGLGKKVDYFCDNGRTLWGTEIDGIPVISPQQLEQLNNQGNLSVLITSQYYDDIKTQLEEMGILVLNTQLIR